MNNTPNGPLHFPLEFNRSKSTLEAIFGNTISLGKSKWCSQVSNYVNQQLSNRLIAKSIGGKEYLKDKISLEICQIIRDNMGWTNDCYDLGDPMLVLLFPHEDGLDPEATLLEIEERFNVDFPRLENGAILPRFNFQIILGWTLRDLIQYVATHPRNG